MQVVPEPSSYPAVTRLFIREGAATSPRRPAPYKIHFYSLRRAIKRW